MAMVCGRLEQFRSGWWGEEFRIVVWKKKIENCSLTRDQAIGKASGRLGVGTQGTAGSVGWPKGRGVVRPWSPGLARQLQHKE